MGQAYRPCNRAPYHAAQRSQTSPQVPPGISQLPPPPMLAQVTASRTQSLAPLLGPPIILPSLPGSRPAFLSQPSSPAHRPHACTIFPVVATHHHSRKLILPGRIWCRRTRSDTKKLTDDSLGTLLLSETLRDCSQYPGASRPPKLACSQPHPLTRNSTTTALDYSRRTRRARQIYRATPANSTYDASPVGARLRLVVATASYTAPGRLVRFPSGQPARTLDADCHQQHLHHLPLPAGAPHYSARCVAARSSAPDPTACPCAAAIEAAPAIARQGRWRQGSSHAAQEDRQASAAAWRQQAAEVSRG